AVQGLVRFPPVPCCFHHGPRRPPRQRLHLLRPRLPHLRPPSPHLRPRLPHHQPPSPHLRPPSPHLRPRLAHLGPPRAHLRARVPHLQPPQRRPRLAHEPHRRLGHRRRRLARRVDPGGRGRGQRGRECGRGGRECERERGGQGGVWGGRGDGCGRGARGDRARRDAGGVVIRIAYGRALGMWVCARARVGSVPPVSVHKCQEVAYGLWKAAEIIGSVDPFSIFFCYCFCRILSI
ncbi:hypothetical protein OF83DRAFT_1207511, partial [Amylostereum chailletii]